MAPGLCDSLPYVSAHAGLPSALLLHLKNCPQYPAQQLRALYHNNLHLAASPSHRPLSGGQHLHEQLPAIISSTAAQSSSRCGEQKQLSSTMAPNRTASLPQAPFLLPRMPASLLSKRPPIHSIRSPPGFGACLSEARGRPACSVLRLKGMQGRTFVQNTPAKIPPPPAIRQNHREAL